MYLKRSIHKNWRIFMRTRNQFPDVSLGVGLRITRIDIVFSIQAGPFLLCFGGFEIPF
jgi:hypothetical protein